MERKACQPTFPIRDQGRAQHQQQGWENRTVPLLSRSIPDTAGIVASKQTQLFLLPQSGPGQPQALLHTLWGFLFMFAKLIPANDSGEQVLATDKSKLTEIRYIF